MDTDWVEGTRCRLLPLPRPMPTPLPPENRALAAPAVTLGNVAMGICLGQQDTRTPFIVFCGAGLLNFGACVRACVLACERGVCVRVCVCVCACVRVCAYVCACTRVSMRASVHASVRALAVERELGPADATAKTLSHNPAPNSASPAAGRESRLLHASPPDASTTPHVDAVGDVFLIFGCGMGVAGAAWATAGSQIASTVLFLLWLRRRGQASDHAPRLRWAVRAPGCTVGVPRPAP